MIKTNINDMKKKKKGLSPVVATVLLIVLILIIALIIFLWMKSVVQETIMKQNTNIENVCYDVSVRASYTNDGLEIQNTGNVPVSKFKVRISSDGDYETLDLEDMINEDWFALNVENSRLYENFNLPAGVDESDVELIPVLLGTSDSGQKHYICEDNAISLY